MEENEYRQTYSDINDIPCAFQKAILTRTCACSRAIRFNLAEREGVACKSPAAKDRCVGFLHYVRENARFTLGLPRITGVLPHAKEMKIQCGGLRGLQHNVDGGEMPTLVADVYTLLNTAMADNTELADLPYPDIVQGVAAFQNKRRSRRK